MGKYKEDKYEEEVDVVIPLSTLDASISRLLLCDNDNETQRVLGCFIQYHIEKYFRECLKNSKKKVKKKNECEFSTTYSIIGYEQE